MSYLADEFTRESGIESRRNLRSASTANLYLFIYYEHLRLQRTINAKKAQQRRGSLRAGGREFQTLGLPPQKPAGQMSQFVLLEQAVPIYQLIAGAADHEWQTAVYMQSFVVPRFQRKTLGGRAFPVAAAQAWNSLPSHVTSSSSLASFKRNLKTELFLRSHVQACYQLLMLRATLLF